MTGPAARRVLVLNAGSSSLKFALFRGLERAWHGQVEGIGQLPRFLWAGPAGRGTRELPIGVRHAAALGEILTLLEAHGAEVGELDACGHRIVHGGAAFVAPMLVDDQHLGELNALRELAPLHNRYGLDAIDAIRAAAPALAQVACFDTAFHATVPEVAARYALPAELDQAGYRRFGFHGLNFEHVTTTLAARQRGALPARLLAFHLGNGCSIAAIHGGRSVATTMGYSTLDGLVMGTRCGAIDPGVLIALQRDRGLGVADIEDLLYRRSGLLGVSGRSSDMRELLAADDDDARFAVEHFCYWAARHAGSLVVALGGLDAVAFTGGIGAGSAVVRSRIVDHLRWLGVALDAERNARGAEEIASAGSRCPVSVVTADEEMTIVRHVHSTLGSAG
jgi:acetate kinase